MPSVVRLSETAPGSQPLPKLGYSAPELVVCGAPVEYGYTYYCDPAGRMIAGIWESEPGSLRFESYPCDEFCYVLSGSITLQETDGEAQEFSAGDSFVICKGFRGLWQMTERTKKYYVECR